MVTGFSIDESIILSFIHFRSYTSTKLWALINIVIILHLSLQIKTTLGKINISKSLIMLLCLHMNKAECLLFF